MTRAGIHALFFLSGSAGLVYQVIWVRQFGNVFGNTVYSASLVTAAFMLGLGLGGFAAGHWADRRYRDDRESLLRYYGLFELGIGALGLAIAAILPRLAPLSALASSYAPDASGWLVLSGASHLFRYAIAWGLLLPVTCLMGGTLTLLIRHLVRSDTSLAGWRVGTLYAVNTAGAALGAFLVDFSLVPRLGLFATQLLAALLNIAVGLAALGWARAASAGPRVAAAPEASAPGRAPMRRLLATTGLAIFLSGFAAMGMEILWFRFLNTVLGGARATFSLLLCVILCGIWLGSLLGGAAQRRFGSPASLYVLGQAGFVASALGLLLGFDPELYRRFDWPALSKSSLETLAQLRVIVFVVAVPAVLTGFAYPLANAIIQRTEASVGGRAGLLYLANTAGAVAGSLVAGFVLLPALGLQQSVLVLAFCALAATLPLLDAVAGGAEPGSRPVRALAATGALGASGVLLVWVLLPPQSLARNLHRPWSEGERVVTFSEGVNESIFVTEVPGSGERMLYTNGHPMSGTAYHAQRYMRAFVHVPLLQLEAPTRALVICFGVGNTLHAASLHPVAELEVVDLSRHVLGHAGWFSRWNGNVLSDPRVRVFVNDGRQHLRMQPPDHYDLVTLEPPPITRAGVSALYSVEFYRLVREHLAPGGFVTQWFPAYQVTPPVARSLARAFLEVFPEGVLLSGYRSELILMGRRDAPAAIDPARLAAALAARPEVRADLEAVDLGTLTELIGSFAASGAALRDAVAGAPPLSDDFPIAEYVSTRFHALEIARDLFDVESIGSWCPRCLADPPPDGLEHLPAYLAHMQALYASDTPQLAGLAPLEDPTIPADPGPAAAARASSRYLQMIFTDGG